LGEPKNNFFTKIISFFKNPKTDIISETESLFKRSKLNFLSNFDSKKTWILLVNVNEIWIIWIFEFFKVDFLKSVTFLEESWTTKVYNGIRCPFCGIFTCLIWNMGEVLVSCREKSKKCIADFHVLGLFMGTLKERNRRIYALTT
jgi:hypothetical protein